MSQSEDAALSQQYAEGASECMSRVVNKDLNVVQGNNSLGPSVAESVADYEGSSSEDGGVNNELKDEEASNSLQRSKTGFFSPRLKSHRRKIIESFVTTNLLLGALVISVLSIYWGATYRRSHFLYKVNMLTVIQDESDVVGTTMSAILPTLIAGVPCTWHIYNESQFTEKYKVPRDQIDSKVVELIHEERYWTALNVRPNATNALYDSLNGGSTAFNYTEYFQVIYESGRDPSSVTSAILPNVKDLESLYSDYVQQRYLPSLIGNLTEPPSIERVIAASDVQFLYLDRRPFYDPQLLAPLQVGLIYCLLLTFFQLSLFSTLHIEMAKILKSKHMIFYRIGISWLTYFFLALFFCTVSAIFEVDFTRAFGRAGFIVYWMSTWLLMMALGGANENMISLIIILGPQYLGFWLMIWIVLNISCSFYPLVLNSDFYRYGYAMPIHNGVDIYKVIFLDLSKHKMGRNYGILIAWVALNTLLLPLVLRFVGKQMQKKAALAAQEKK